MGARGEWDRGRKGGEWRGGAHFKKGGQDQSEAAEPTMKRREKNHVK